MKTRSKVKKWELEALERYSLWINSMAPCRALNHRSRKKIKGFAYAAAHIAMELNPSLRVKENL